MSDYSKNIVYLSKAQYSDLVANGSITVDGVTVTYDENDIYVTPQEEPVTDVTVDGTSVVTDGVANVPIGGSNRLGVFGINEGNGITVTSSGNLKTNPSTDGHVRTGTEGSRPITPNRQHMSTFYGLAKAAGHDEKDSAEPLGTYTPEAKGAIQSMLGVSGLMAPEENDLVASRAYAVGDVFTANGKLYKATAAIAADGAILLPGSVGENCEAVTVADEFVKKTDYASSAAFGIIRPSSGLLSTNGFLTTDKALISESKAGNNPYKPIVPQNQHASAFYGLAKAAGDITQSSSDNAVGTYTDDAKSAIRTMLGAVGDVRVDGASVVTDGVANVPVAVFNGGYGVVKLVVGNGIGFSGAGNLMITTAIDSAIKNGTNSYTPITPYNQEKSVFYGLAKASGDTTQTASSNAVGVYTDNAKASIKAMLGIVDGSTGTVDVTGTTPTITAVENTRYVCGEVTSLSFTPPESGIAIVRFTSGTSVAVLTIPSTVKFPEWFDPTSLETNTIYEICVTDGVYGAVMSWAL